MNSYFEIVVYGVLPPEWAEVFEGLVVTSRPDGNTILAGELPDQAALYGLLVSLRDWGLTLISVNPVSNRKPPACHFLYTRGDRNSSAGRTRRYKMNLSFSKILPISRERSDVSKREAEAVYRVKDHTNSIPWIFKLITENQSTPGQDHSWQPSVPSTQFARFLLMSRLQ